MNFKQRMLFTITALIILGFAISAFSSFRIARQQALNSLMKQEMPLTLDNVYSEIQRDLLMPQLVSSLMANDTFLHQWVETQEQDVTAISRYLSNIKEKYGLFTAFFVSESSKDYFYAGGLLKTISDKNPLDNWYFRFRSAPGESELNIDPDMSNADQLAIFINAKVHNKDNTLVGITGVGLNLEDIKGRFDYYQQKYGKSVYFVNKQGQLLLSGSNAPVPGNIYQKEGIKDIAAQVLKATEGSFSYRYQGENYLLLTRYIKELDLVLCVEAQSGKITAALLKPLIINIVTSLLLLVSVLYLIMKIINRYQAKLEKIAWRDHLTGLFNRRSFTLQYQKEEYRCRRQEREMALLLIDIDFFKKINDSKGHLHGDKVLKQCALTLEDALRLTDTISRWGGEEFVVLLPDTSVSAALKIAERLRLLVEKDALLKKLTDSGLTISIGVAAFDMTRSMDWHISVADNKLYKAKNSGRNCVVY